MFCVCWTKKKPKYFFTNYVKQAKMLYIFILPFYTQLTRRRDNVNLVCQLYN